MRRGIVIVIAMVIVLTLLGQIATNAYRSFSKVSLNFYPILTKLGRYRHVSAEILDTKFHQILLVGVELFHADGVKDEWT
jgi:hypothetical protein